MAVAESWSPTVQSRVLAGFVVSMGESGRVDCGKRFICSDQDCDATFNKAWKLSAHMCKHTGERPYTCEYDGCGKGFTRNFHLARHMLTHTGEKPFVCSEGDCKEAFTTNANLRKHIERKHSNQGKPYVCDFEGCGKAYKKHQQLRVHQCHHTNELPFKCSHQDCGKSFPLPSKLIRHEKVHEGYPCRIKDCSFLAKTWTENLKHVREDHVEDHICDVCDKKFKRKDYLKEHQKSHLVEREVYLCPTEGCERKYTTLFNLQNHVLSFHEEVRPFVCEHPECGKTFAMKQSLERHAVIHDPEKRKLKVRRPRPKRSLASRLSGYMAPKTIPAQDTALIPAEVSKSIGESQEPLSVEALALS
ncbi:transcription factor IIIA [Ambystoma mexicanum]|uniref:transcription factor IIIA n=1 Tax=Ambystoma mexicanum TaxID=8296 RepID=UPI0037E88D0E